MAIQLGFSVEGRARPWLGLVMGLVFSVIGLGLLVGSYITYHSARLRLERWVRTVGIVTSLEEKWEKNDEGASVTYAPKVKFVLPSGEEYHFIGSVSARPPSYTAGEQVRVLYNPQQPSEADIDSFMNHWFLPLALLVMGVAFVPTGVYLAAGALKEIRRAAQPDMARTA